MQLQALITFADEWIACSWRASLASLIVLALLLLARPRLLRRLSPHTASWLWLVPLAPLALPFVPGPLRAPWPAAPVGVLTSPATSQRDAALTRAPDPDRARLAPLNDPAHEAARGQTQGPVRVVGPNSDSDAESAPRSELTAMQRRLALLGLGWWSVSLALLVATAVRVLATHALVRAARPCEDAALRCRFARLAREQGAPRSTRLLLADGLASPATAGLLRAYVLVSPDAIERLAPEELEFALRHELAHARRRDVLCDALVRVVRAVWFFHPSVWVAPRFADRARELACDEAAVARGCDPLGAARALLQVIELGRSGAALGAGSVPLAHHLSLEEERVMQLIQPSRPALRGLSPLAAVGLAVAAIVSLPGASRAQALEPAVSSTPGSGVRAQVAARARDQGSSASDARNAESTLRGSLRWLVAQQQEDGRWRASSVEGTDFAGELDDVGTTAAVLLALHGARADAALEGRREALERGVRFLDGQRDRATGAFTRTTQNLVCVPSHAWALRAWIVVNATDESPLVADWRAAAVAGVRFVEAARNPYGAWRYSVPPIGDNDSVITGWALMALAEARRHGIEVPKAALDGGRAFFDQVFDPTTGRVGYARRGEPTSRLAAKADAYPGDLVEFPTAVATCAQLALGASPLESDTLFSSALLLAAKPPVWSRGKGTIDSYYWAFGTQALQVFGGALSARWNAALGAALVEHAERDASGAVWWEAIDAWHDAGSEVGMTAMCALALQAASASASDR